MGAGGKKKKKEMETCTIRAKLKQYGSKIHLWRFARKWKLKSCGFFCSEMLHVDLYCYQRGRQVQTFKAGEDFLRGQCVPVIVQWKRSAIRRVQIKPEGGLFRGYLPSYIFWVIEGPGSCWCCWQVAVWEISAFLGRDALVWGQSLVGDSSWPPKPVEQN